MGSPSPPGVTELLRAWNDGDEDALRQLVPLVYPDLKALAHHYLAHQGSGHTLQATALVHEAYLRLAAKQEVHWSGRVHFFAVIAHILRGILVDYARAQHAAKRGGGGCTVALEEASAVSKGKDVELLDLDAALSRLADLDPQQGRIVELRFFGGLSIDETGQALGISPATVKRDWLLAKTWIYREMYGAACDA